MKCRLDFPCLVIPDVGGISYRRYHKIDMHRFCEGLADMINIFVTLVVC